MCGWVARWAERLFPADARLAAAVSHMHGPNGAEPNPNLSERILELLAPCQSVSDLQVSHMNGLFDERLEECLVHWRSRFRWIPSGHKAGR
jgi:hypothetical protein